MIEGFYTYTQGMELEDMDEIAPWFSTADSNIAYGIGHSPSDMQKVKALFLLNTSATPKRRNFIVREKTTHNILGMVQFNNMDWSSRSTDLAILLTNEKFRNKGYGTDIKISIVNFIFNQWNMRYIYGNYPKYIESITQINEKLGASIVGYLPNNIYIDGKYHDSLYYVLNKEIFNTHYIGKENEWKDYIQKKVKKDSTFS